VDCILHPSSNHDEWMDGWMDGCDALTTIVDTYVPRAMLLETNIVIRVMRVYIRWNNTKMIPNSPPSPLLWPTHLDETSSRGAKKRKQQQSTCAHSTTPPAPLPWLPTMRFGTNSPREPDQRRPGPSWPAHTQLYTVPAQHGTCPMHTQTTQQLLLY
jgi:hypothetical protein